MVISNQGAIRYEPGKNLEHYLKGAGGILETGEENSFDPSNGKTERMSRNNRLL